MPFRFLAVLLALATLWSSVGAYERPATCAQSSDIAIGHIDGTFEEEHPSEDCRRSRRPILHRKEPLCSP